MYPSSVHSCLTSIFRTAGMLLAAFGLQALAPFSSADTLEAFRDRQEKVQAVAKSATATTVAITSSRGGGTGSGVIISAEGLVLTAAHVTEATGKALTIIFSDGRRVNGVALGANKTVDAGMARITEDGPWPFSEIGLSDITPMGSWCIALGHPGGFLDDRPPPVRIGRIWHRDQYGALYSDCTLIGGDSGGPLFNVDGQVIGIHSSIGGSLSTNRHAATDSFRRDWDRLLKGDVWGKLHLDPDQSDLATMGVELDWKGEDGARIRAVRTNAPAAEAGAKAGDVIVQFAGVSIESSIQLLRKLSEMNAGDLASMTVRRSDELVDLELKLTDYKSLTSPPSSPDQPADDAPYLGVIDLEASETGVKVGGVDTSGPATEAGVETGDIVTAIDDTTIDSPSGLVDEVLTRLPETPITLSIIRGGAKMTITVQLGRQ